MKRQLNIIALLGLCAVFGLGLRGISHAANEPTSLIQIHLQSSDDLIQLSRLNLQIYAQLVSPEAEVYLLTPLTAAQQNAITDLGLHFQVLDSDTKGQLYQLLYFPTPDQLVLFEDSVLVYDGRHAVLRASSPGVNDPLPVGATLHDLILHPLILPDPDLAPEYSPIITPDPVIQAMMDQVNSLEASDWVGGLSGEWPVEINGSPYTLETRYSRTTIPIDKATRYVHDALESYGLTMDYQYYNLPGSGERRNVIAEQTGVTQPERVVMLTAHLDSTTYQNPMLLAPGADDNASGSAGVLMAAEILSQYDFGCTLRYALFTGEEQGLYGSAAYAAEAFAQGDNIEAVVNLDMIGYNSDANPYFELHTRPSNSADLAIASLFAEVVDAYNINLWPLVLQDGITYSDHSSFWNYGFPAILAIEDDGDFTPYYHSTNDLLSTLNIAYMTDLIKSAVGTFAHMGCEVIPPGPTPTPTQTPTATPTFTATPTPTMTPEPPFSEFLPVMSGNPLDSAPTPMCTNVIINGGFETVEAWEMPLTVYPAVYTTDQNNSGAQAMRAGIANPADNIESYSSFQQEISVPAGGANAPLGFWLYSFSEEAGASPPPSFPVGTPLESLSVSSDAQYLLILDANFEIQETLFWQVEDQQAWNFHTYDLSPYAGQTIYIHFGTYNDGGQGITGFFTDDVSLMQCGP